MNKLNLAYDIKNNKLIVPTKDDIEKDNDSILWDDEPILIKRDEINSLEEFVDLRD